jgi:hypothetical protein
VAVTVPLVILGLGLGLWDSWLGEVDQWEIELQLKKLGQVVARMEDRIAAVPHREMEVQFRRNGQLCAGLAQPSWCSRKQAHDASTRWTRIPRSAGASIFSVLRRLMPPLLGLQVLLLAICAVTAVAFEALAILEGADFRSGSLILLGMAAVLISASLWPAMKTVVQLRRTMTLFEPDPMTILGRPLVTMEAPGL